MWHNVLSLHRINTVASSLYSMYGTYPIGLGPPRTHGFAPNPLSTPLTHLID
jgi:hypothetical protein